MKSIRLLTVAATVTVTSLFAETTPPSELQISAASGNATAQFELGRAYFRGDGLPNDKSKAHEWLLKSAEQGNPDAITTMGYFYSTGIVLEKDEAKAVEWFRKGADAGSAKSLLNLGLMLRQAKTIPLDNNESLKWLELAAATDDPDAVRTYGQLLFLGDSLIMPDRKKAFPFVLKSAEAGDAASQNMVGVAYRDGDGTEKNHEKAKEWFLKAALQNDPKAQSNLGHILGVDSPASPDRKEALKWLLIAKDNGEITAIKTYKELMTTFPPALLALTQKEANKFLLVARAKSSKPRDTTESKTEETRPANEANPRE
jgi:TPR repeat protein